MNKSEQLSKIVENDEPLARYIFSKMHFSKQKKRIKRHAFMPLSKGEGKDKMSVIRHKSCPQDCLLKIGHNIANSRQSSLKAIGSIMAGKVRSINNLNVESDTSGGQHRRHANITGFCNYNDGKIRNIAQKLANEASLLYVIDEF